jgi:Protein of unknown function (DUF3455)
MQNPARKVLHALFGLTLTCVAQAQAADATQPPSTQHAVLAVQGKGSQVYGCQPVNGVFQWVFLAPVARLFDASGREVGTHGDGPVWNDEDGSSTQGVLATKSNSPDQGSIPWLLLKAVNQNGTGVLATVEFIRRSDTHGGVAPITGCDAAHQGELARVPYTATYTFYTSKPASN